jgi:hypothetical protein
MVVPSGSITAGLLRVSMLVVTATVFPATLCAQGICEPNDPCVCVDCCWQFETYQWQCQHGGTCTLTICVGGPNTFYGAESECVSCCGGKAQNWFQTGTCGVTSPAREKRSAVGASAQLFFVRGCDGTYSLVRLGSARA